MNDNDFYKALTGENPTDGSKKFSDVFEKWLGGLPYEESSEAYYDFIDAIALINKEQFFMGIEVGVYIGSKFISNTEVKQHEH